MKNLNRTLYDFWRPMVNTMYYVYEKGVSNSVERKVDVGLFNIHCEAFESAKYYDEEGHSWLP